MVNKTFHVTVPETDEEIAADRLWQLGVEAVGIGQAIDGNVELWTSVGASEQSVARAVAVLDDGWTWRVEDIVEPTETWREHVAPTWYRPNGVVVPSWQVGEFDIGADTLITAIEPASSFGLGDHPTTRLSLALLAEHLDAVPVASLLDVGCGSGVLGIMAAQMGVRTVRSTDVSAAAIEATRANAVLNGVAGAIEVDRAPLERVGGPYDVVVANILAPVLVSLAPHLGRLTGPRGTLIISGILTDNHEHVIGSLAPMRRIRTLSENGWSAVALAMSPS